MKQRALGLLVALLLLVILLLIGLQQYSGYKAEIDTLRQPVNLTLTAIEQKYGTAHP